MTVDCYIFDDSTTNQQSADTLKVIAEQNLSNLAVHVVDSARQNQFIEVLQRGNRSTSEFVRSWCKQLGCGPWDAAGVRNFAFIYLYAVSDKSDLILFLDDDMMFEDIVYHDHLIKVDGAAAIQELFDATMREQANVSGAKYWGRMDVSVLRHLRYVSKLLRLAMEPERRSQLEPLLRSIAESPQVLPIRIETPSTPDDFREPLGPGGISGAVLATTPVALLSHGNMRVYNEDWIWQALLGASREDIRCIASKVVHAPPPQMAVTEEFANFQERGEIVYEAVNRIMDSAPSTCDRLDFCQRTASIQHFADAKESEIHSIQDCLHEIRNASDALAHLEGTSVELRLIPPAIEGLRRSAEYVEAVYGVVVADTLEQVADDFFSYLSAIPTWRRCLEQIRGHTRENIGSQFD